MGKTIYFTFEKLQSLEVGMNGFYKPSGTMGRHHMLISKHASHIVVRGSESGDVTVHPNDILGYQHGEVFVVKPTRDPVKKLLRSKRISTRILEVSNEPVQYCTGSQSLGGHDHIFDVGENAIVLGEAPTQDEIVGEGYEVNGHGSRPSQWGWESKVSGGEVVVVTSSYMSGPINQTTKVSRIVIRPGVTRTRAATLLAKWFDR